MWPLRALVISQAQGPVVLVGHSYGGVVVTEAGTDPKVKGLVYIAAFAPDKGDSVIPSSKIRLLVHRSRRSCRPRTAIYSSTRQNSALRSQPTSAKQRLRSWPTIRCRGVLVRSPAQ